VKVSKVLRKAADHIETYGHHKGYFWPDGESFDAPYTAGDPCCALGAIAVVEGVDPTIFDTEAMQFVADHLAMTTPRFADWNDSHSDVEVLAILRAASEQAKRLGR